MLGACHCSVCSRNCSPKAESQDAHPGGPGSVVAAGRGQEDWTAGNYPESALPLQRVNYREAEDLKIQLAETNKQTKPELSHC